MTKPFFLTRQAADLMDDFARELSSQPGILLLYGDEGVGKTRLINELVETRLAERRVRWMDLKAGGSGDGPLVDSSQLIEKTFARAKAGDVIVADHIEMALKKTRHQLFLSWSSDGLERKLNLIVVARSKSVSELRQLAQQYQVAVQRFEQKPFDPGEVTAFLGFYLFPNREIDELVIPPLLRNQLARAQGNLASVVDIAERAGDQISNARIRNSQPVWRNRRMITGALGTSALVLLLGLGWFFLEQPPGINPVQQESVAQVTTSSESDAERPQVERQAPAQEHDDAPASSKTEATADDNLVALVVVAKTIRAEVTEPADLLVDYPETVESDTGTLTDTDDIEIVVEADDSPQIPLQENADVAQAATDNGATAPDDTPAVIAITGAESGSSFSATISETQVEEADATMSGQNGEAVAGADTTVLEAAEPASWGSSRLRQDLQASTDWIAARSADTGTLQIMLLSQAKFNEQVYYRHIDRLADEGVDVAQIRIFEAYAGNQAILSVVYGEYASRAAANESKPELPPVLREEGPVARSVGALRVEIERLREQN